MLKEKLFAQKFVMISEIAVFFGKGLKQLRIIVIVIVIVKDKDTDRQLGRRPGTEQ